MMTSIGNKKILITGGAGFIGSRPVVVWLIKNRIASVDNFSSGSEVEGR